MGLGVGSWGVPGKNRTEARTPKWRRGSGTGNVLHSRIGGCEKAQWVKEHCLASIKCGPSPKTTAA